MYRVKEISADMVFPVLYREMNRMEKEGINFPVAESYWMLTTSNDLFVKSKLINDPNKVCHMSLDELTVYQGLMKYLEKYNLEWIMNPYHLTNYIMEFLGKFIQSVGGGYYICDKDGKYVVLFKPETIINDKCDILLIRQVLENY